MAEQRNTYEPGGDAKAISRIAKGVYGGYREMFDAHGWDAPGTKLMSQASSKIAAHYGSIREFEDRHLSVWDRGYSVFLTSFWDWTPETWGTIGWTGDRGKSRRDTLLQTLTNPFIAVIYITNNQSAVDKELKGKIAGFYLVSHEKGDRDDFSDPIHHSLPPEKWRHSLKALRAFSYLPEQRLSAVDFDSSLSQRALSIAAMGEIIEDTRKIDLLRNTPWIEFDVYKGDNRHSNDADSTVQSRNLVHAGPANVRGYQVEGNTHLKHRELYILRLNGDIDAYLGKPAQGGVIIKIGVAISPELRRQHFAKAMPRGAFSWEIDRTLTSCGLRHCANHDHAVACEDAMKLYLSQNAEHLGGEFYLASESAIDKAWELGCEAARTYDGAK